MRWHLAHLDWLLQFGIEHGFGKWHFLVHRFKAKAMVEACKTVTGRGPSGTIVGLGGWSNQSVIKGHVRAPIQAFRRALGLLAVVVILDEFLASKRCSSCGGEVTNLRFSKAGDCRRLHGVVRRTNPACFMSWGRGVASLMSSFRKRKHPYS
jgi:hypothetical protein